MTGTVFKAFYTTGLLVLFCPLKFVSGANLNAESASTGNTGPHDFKQDEYLDLKYSKMSELKDMWTSDVGQRMKTELKQEILRNIFTEIIQEIEEDIRHGSLETHLPEDIKEMRENVKEQLRNDLYSEAENQHEKPAHFGEKTKKDYFQEMGKGKESVFLKFINAPKYVSPTTENMQEVGARNSMKGSVLDRNNPLERFAEKSMFPSRQKIQNTGVKSKRSLGTRQAERVAFTAYLDHDLYHLAVLQTIKFNQVLLNDGNGYNIYTGVFTAPISGIYLFSVHFMSFVGKAELQLVVDNGGIVDTSVNHVPDKWSGIQAGNVAVIRVNAGQSVWVQTYNTADQEVDGGTIFKETTFVGVLLYAV